MIRDLGELSPFNFDLIPSLEKIKPIFNNLNNYDKAKLFNSLVRMNYDRKYIKFFLENDKEHNILGLTQSELYSTLLSFLKLSQNTNNNYKTQVKYLIYKDEQDCQEIEC